MKNVVDGKILCDACFVGRLGSSLPKENLLHKTLSLADLVQGQTIRDPNSERCTDCYDHVDVIPVEDSHFGACPICGKGGVNRNIHRLNVFACDEHKVCWVAGDNLLSGWRDENEEIWKQNAELLNTYKEVNPIHVRHRRLL